MTRSRNTVFNILPYSVLLSEKSAEIRSITPLDIGALTAIYAEKLKPPVSSKSPSKTPEGPSIILAGSLDGRIAVRLLTDRGQKLQDLGLAWTDSDRLSVRRIQLLDLAARGASELTCRFLVAKANFVVLISLRLAYTAKSAAWRLAEAKTLSSLNAGLGTVVGMEMSEEGDLLVSSQKGPVLR
jgi:hypothetical protein